MTRAELKSSAKEQIKGNVGKYFLCSFIVSAVLLTVSYLFMSSVLRRIIIRAVMGLPVSLAPIYAFEAVMFILAAPITYSFTKLNLGMTYDEKVTVSGFFKGFKKAGSSILLFIVMQLFTFLWSLLLIIPGIIKSLSYSMAFYVLADNPEMTAMDALNESKEIMKGHKWELFVLYLSFILWLILGMVTFGLAFIYIKPYIGVTIANFYNSIKGISIEENFNC